VEGKKNQLMLGSEREKVVPSCSKNKKSVEGLGIKVKDSGIKF